MLSARGVITLYTLGIRRFANVAADLPSHFSVANVEKKSLEDLLEPVTTPEKIKIPDGIQKVKDLDGTPVDVVCSRRVRIYRPARQATQSGWANTKTWKIEFDNQERWENPLIGWSSSGDPLSNISMAMDFASKEDAIRFCEKNNLNYEVVQPNERIIKPKNYAENFSWNKRTRITNK
ncbi:unnamed protein product [Thelazia callipaeda]|uniref:NADH dehydrogenase [ubiquinone] iron-sulfur protein 4, mitochondrial n=1 Tax=Thelazia callipaeda TaxID=103827 RepID=A0A0N5CWL0_THECL|nr:unnamed protein product [Thelazia callipaeda]